MLARYFYKNPGNLSFPCVLALALSVGACSSTGYKLLSVPEGAEVSTLQGEVLGKTPLILTPEQTAKINENNHLRFKMALAGHIPRVVFADAKALSEIQLQLVPTNAESFKGEFSKDFRLELNQMLRASYDIQRLLSERKTAEAKAAAVKFKADYPQLAYGYMITAHLALREGKRDEARANILQAQALDPGDPAVAQALQLLGGGKPSP